MLKKLMMIMMLIIQLIFLVKENFMNMMIEQLMNLINQNSSYRREIFFVIKIISFFREPPKNRNRFYKDTDSKWQHDLFHDYDDEPNSRQTNYRGQMPRRGGRGRFKLVSFSTPISSFYFLFSVVAAVVVVAVIEINYI